MSTVTATMVALIKGISRDDCKIVSITSEYNGYDAYDFMIIFLNKIEIEAWMSVNRPGRPGHGKICICFDRHTQHQPFIAALFNKAPTANHVYINPTLRSFSNALKKIGAISCPR